MHSETHLEIKEIHVSIRITTNQCVPWAIHIDFLLPSKLHLSFGTCLMTSSCLYLDARTFTDSKALDLSYLLLCTLVTYLGYESCYYSPSLPSGKRKRYMGEAEGGKHSFSSKTAELSAGLELKS